MVGTRICQLPKVPSTAEPVLRASGNTRKRRKRGRHAPMIGRIVASGAMNNTCSRYALPFGHVEAFDDTESGEEDGKRFV